MAQVDVLLVLRWIERLSNTFQRQAEYLNQLDAQLGDGDHGAGLARGFAAAEQQIASKQFPDLGYLLVAVGRSLMSVAGGASGSLFGVVFVEMGKGVQGQSALNLAEFRALAQRGVAALKKLGQVSPGEKTMLDALQPAVDALQGAEQQPLAAALRAAALAARAGAEATKDMVAQRGRARFTPGGGRGHQDPGATSMALVWETLAEVAEEL